jgi:hypothetical protein
MAEDGTAWRTYEQVAVYLLNQFADTLGLERVEGKQRIIGNITTTKWEIDGKGVKINNEGFLVIEIRRRTKDKLEQEAVAAVAYRIQDVGADGGIIVSPLGFQEGAAKVARAENILEVHMDEDSTTTEYMLRFLDKAFIGTTDVAAITDEIAVIKVAEAHSTCQTD